MSWEWNPSRNQPRFNITDIWIPFQDKTKPVYFGRYKEARPLTEEELEAYEKGYFDGGRGASPWTIKVEEIPRVIQDLEAISKYVQRTDPRMATWYPRNIAQVIQAFRNRYDAESKNQVERGRAIQDVLASKGVPDSVDTGPLGNIMDMVGMKSVPKKEFEVRRGSGRRKTRRAFKFPRKMSRTYCKKTPCRKMGFTQRSSCRPYKNCSRG